MKKAMILITALLAITLISTQAFSKGHGKGEFGNHHRMNQTVWNDLSQEQRDQLTDLRQQFVDDTYELRSSVMLKKNQARMLMETSNPSKADLLKLSDEVADLKKQIHEKRIDLVLAAKKIAPELTLDGFGMGKEGGRGKGGCRNQDNCQKQGRGCGQSL